MDTGPSRRQAILALVLLVPAPTLGVAASMVIPDLRGTMLGQGIWLFSKVWLVAFPLVWWRLVDRQAISWSPMKRGGLGTGFVLGLIMAAVLAAIYWLPAEPPIDPNAIRDQAALNGLDRWPKYLALALGLSFINALVEEYVWRWFVYSRWLPLVKQKAFWAVPLAAACFTAHHTVILAVQMGFWATLFGSLAVFTAGCVWSWCYARYQSVWPGYLCHILADLAIFAVGWDIIFQNP